MEVRCLEISHFRGLERLRIQPNGHVVLVGPPGVGRTTVLAALSKVLDPDGLAVPATELDFHLRQTEEPIVVEVTLGDLSEALKQTFFDYLELWDSGVGLVPELKDPAELDLERYEPVVRIAWCCGWLPAEERADERRYYPKGSDPATGTFTPVRRADLATLPFASLRWAGSTPLSLSTRSSFRRIIERESGDDFGAAVDAYLTRVGQAAQEFADSKQLGAAVERVLKTVHLRLGIEAEAIGESVAFTPDGGSESGLLRSLGPELSLWASDVRLPLARSGRTAETLLRLAEASALAAVQGNGMLLVDDLGDGIDLATASHTVRALGQVTQQLWVTTRLPGITGSFEVDELVRMGRTATAGVEAYAGQRPKDKSERMAIRHASRGVMEALSFHGVLIVEAPDDQAAFSALAIRRFDEAGIALPASSGLAIVPSSEGGSGGSSAVVRASRLAKALGLYTVALIDGDKNDADAVLAQAAEAADLVIRLPDGVALERACLLGLPDGVLRDTLMAVSATGVTNVPDFEALPADQLLKAAVPLLKGHGGLHAAFISALPEKVFPPLGVAMLDAAVDGMRNGTTGVVQL